MSAVLFGVLVFVVALVSANFVGLVVLLIHYRREQRRMRWDIARLAPSPVFLSPRDVALALRDLERRT